MKKTLRNGNLRAFDAFFIYVLLLLVSHPTKLKATNIPSNLVNDPVAKALGPEIMNAAIKKIKIVHYTGCQWSHFLKMGKSSLKNVLA